MFKKLSVGALFLAAVVTIFIFGARAGWYGVSRVEVERLSGTTPAGTIYFLPRAVIGVEATYRITKCDVTRRPGAPEAVSMDAEISARLLDMVEPDFNKGYVIKAGSISGSWWRTDVIIETQNGILKNVNSISAAEYAVPKELQLEQALAQIAKCRSGRKLSRTSQL